VQIFLHATKKISQSKIPLIHEVIPIIDVITHVLDDFIADSTKFPIIHAATRRGLAMINKYYGLTDNSVIYRVAMCLSFYYATIILLSKQVARSVLHPCYKATYFARAKWPQEWVKMAEDILRDQ
jgi:hypothetical protein